SRQNNALLDLGMWRNGNYAVACLLIFVVGIVLFATLALLPPYLSQIVHYPVMDIGLLLAPRGVGTMLGMMLVGRLLGRIDARWPIFTGMLLTAGSLYFMCQFGVAVSRSDVVWIGFRPRPRPCKKPIQPTSLRDTSTPNWHMKYSEPAVSSMPVKIGQRASIRPSKRPTSIIPSMVPTPRGASSRPMSMTG